MKSGQEKSEKGSHQAVRGKARFFIFLRVRRGGVKGGLWLSITSLRQAVFWE